MSAPAAPIETSNAASEASRRRLVSKITWRLLPFLLILYVVSYLDRINLSFAALQMNADLHFKPEVYGFGSGIFFLGYCLFGIPSNLIIERLGPRRWISLIMVAWGFVTLGMCLVWDVNSFYALRFTLGLAEAGFFPGMLLYLTYWFPPKQYGMAVARFMTAVPLAGVIGSLMAAKTLAMGGLAGLAGWKWLFLVTGAPAILLGICVFFILADRPDQAKWLSLEEKAEVLAMIGAKTQIAAEAVGDKQSEALPNAAAQSSKISQAKPNQESSIYAAFTSLLVWRAAGLYFSMSVCMYGFQLWLPQIVQTFGKTDDSQTALLSALPAVAQGFGMQMIAANSDRTGERRFHVVAAALITCVGLLAACLLPGSFFKLSGMCLAAFGIWGTLGPFWALTRQSLKPVAQPAAIAFINSIGGLGGFVGPYLVGLVQKLYSAPNAVPGRGESFASALILLASAALITALIAALSKPVKSDT
ncbi:MAG: MFS transporter [Cyanobacteria bacterium REEB67]|nr:MFS transporter [Cyanobacteria bacterium REEB67]